MTTPRVWDVWEVAEGANRKSHAIAAFAGNRGSLDAMQQNRSQKQLCVAQF
jgi:hypothetical protein